MRVKKPHILQHANYTPCRLFDTLKQRYGYRSDAKLCDAINLHAPYMSRVRTKDLPVTAQLLLRLHDCFDIPIAELRELSGLTGVKL